MSTFPLSQKELRRLLTVRGRALAVIQQYIAKRDEAGK